MRPWECSRCNVINGPLAMHCESCRPRSDKHMSPLAPSTFKPFSGRCECPPMWLGTVPPYCPVHNPCAGTYTITTTLGQVSS